MTCALTWPIRTLWGCWGQFL